jgi:hypothetical protein
MTRRTRLWLSGALAVVLFLVLAAIDGRMHDAGDTGIVGFELAGSADKADRIRADWGDEGRDAALLSLLVDYPYLLAYGTFGILAVSAVRDRLPRFGAIALGAAVLAPASDAVENAFLLVSLSGDTWAALPGTVFALLKFAAIVVSLLYVLTALLNGRLGGRSAG